MKWFKHMTGSIDDEKISRLLDIAGLEGYGFYWRIIEIIAGQIGKDSEKCEVTYSLPSLSRLTYSHHNKVGNLLGKLQVTGLIDVSKSELDGRVNFTLKCRNILKYRDEWTARGEKTRESLGSHSGATPEEIQIQNKIQNKSIIASSVKTSEAPKRKIALVDQQFIEQLIKDPAYEGIDVKREATRAESWLSNNPKAKGRKFTKKFLLNWLLRADANKPSESQSSTFDPVEYFGGVKTY